MTIEVEETVATATTRPLPPGWRWTTVQALGAEGEQTVLTGPFGADRGSDDLIAAGVPVLTIGCMSETGIDLDKAQYVSEQKAAQLGRYRLRYGDVLFSRMASVGRCEFVSESFEGAIVNYHLMRLRLSPHEVDPQFFVFYVRESEVVREYVKSINRGSTRDGINSGQLLQLPVALPPLPEQRRIAAILREQMAAVDRARAAAQAQLDAAKALPAAYLRAVFESDEARGWPMVKVRQIAAVSGGIQKTPNRTPTSFHRPFLTVRNVYRDGLDLSALERFEVTPAELERYRLRTGDLLIVEGNGSPDQIGRNAIFRGEIEDCVHQNHLIRVRIDRSVAEPDFVSRYLNSDQGKAQMLEKAMTTTGLHTLSVSKVEQLDVPLPALAVQRQQVRILDATANSAGKVIQAAQEQLDAINWLPAALLRRAFNGEV